MDDDDFYTTPVHHWHPGNIWHGRIDNEKTTRQQNRPLYRIKSNVATVERGGNTAAITLVAMLTAVALGFLALCLHIWFNILPIKG